MVERRVPRMVVDKAGWMVDYSAVYLAGWTENNWVAMMDDKSAE
jgi:hypothetical protein